jgi:polysaccharide export outer membrane protein
VVLGGVLLTFVVRIGAVGLALIAVGCTLMPASGPNSVAVQTGSMSAIPYAVVRLTPQTVDVLAKYEPAGLSGVFASNRPPPTILFNVGDVVSITIFEAAAGGLFIPIEAGVRPGNYVTLPNQSVDSDGNISVPYAGIVKASGRTNIQIQNDIVAKIRNRAIEPQVVVALATQNSSLVSVFGEVGTPIRYPAAGSGASDRITDAITRAGGIKDQGYQTWVMLERHGKRGTVPFANLVYEPSNNIFVQPGDRIYVYQEDQKFMAFGASGTQGEFPFGAWRINLASAVAKSGGLVDGQADPGSVFLYRSEPRHVAEQLGADVTKFEGDIVPVIFSVDFRDPAGYFLATQMQMRNADVIFVANAQAVEITKFADFLNTIMATTSNGVSLREQIKATEHH